MNKKIKIILSMVCMFVMSFSLSVTGFADDTDGNTSFGTAETISVNSLVYGDFMFLGDDDYYKFVLSDDGYFSVTFNHPYYEKPDYANSWFADVVIYRENGSNRTELLTMHSEYESETVSSIKLGVKSGTYYVKAAVSYSYGWEYNLTVNYVRTNDWEKAPNGQFSNANEIDVNKTYFGSLTFSDDDYFKFEIPNDGYINVKFEHKYSENSETFASLRVFSYNGTAETDLLKFYSKFKNEKVSSVNLGLKAGTYYLEISENAGRGREYSFCVNYKSADNWEKTPNGIMTNATPISIGKTYYGTLTGEDKDQFWFELSRDGFITVNYKHKYCDEIGNHAVIHVYSYDGTNSNEHLKFSSQNKSESTESSKVKLKAGKYYLKIVESAAFYADYNFTVNFTTKAPEVTTTPQYTQGYQPTTRPQQTQKLPQTTKYNYVTETYETLPEEPVSLNAENADTTYVYKNYIYIIVDFEVVICGYAGYDTSDVVPSEIDGMPVTGIAAEAFSGSDIQEIEIPSSVKRFGKDALKSHYGNVKIKCEEGSAAEKYAVDNGFEFEYIYDESDNLFADNSSNPRNPSFIPVVLVAVVFFITTVALLIVLIVKKKKEQ